MVRSTACKETEAVLLGRKAQLVAESAMLRMELQVSAWSRAKFAVGVVAVPLSACRPF